jgi:hypothetical protein
MNTPDLSGGQNNNTRFLGFEKGINIYLTRQIQRFAISDDNVGELLISKFPDQRRAHHPIVSSYID